MGLISVSTAMSMLQKGVNAYSKVNYAASLSGEISKFTGKDYMAAVKDESGNVNIKTTINSLKGKITSDDVSKYAPHYQKLLEEQGQTSSLGSIVKKAKSSTAASMVSDLGEIAVLGGMGSVATSDVDFSDLGIDISDFVNGDYDIPSGSEFTSQIKSASEKLKGSFDVGDLSNLSTSANTNLSAMSLNAKTFDYDAITNTISEKADSTKEKAASAVSSGTSSLEQSLTKVVNSFKLGG